MAAETEADEFIVPWWCMIEGGEYTYVTYGPTQRGAIKAGVEFWIRKHGKRVIPDTVVAHQDSRHDD